jgi:hypothetical protein
MRRSVLTVLTTLSLTALIACATAPVDSDLSSLVQEQQPSAAEENNSAKLQPPSNPAKDQPADAKDAGTGTPIKQDSGTPPPPPPPPPPADAGPPPTGGGDCDANDPMYYIKFIAAGSPTPCPCSASECCYIGLACLPK